MEQSPLRLIKRFSEYIPVGEINRMPLGLRGIYVLYKKRPRIGSYDVVYPLGLNRFHDGLEDLLIKSIVVAANRLR